MEIKYIVIVQCHIVTEKCPGFFCENAFTKRVGAFTEYKGNSHIRCITVSCGGCCGRAVHRKLSLLLKTLKKREGIEKESVIVHLASCIAFDNFHAPPCPHINYLKELIGVKLGLPIKEGTKISDLSEKRRSECLYQPRS
ncbi:MAG TPA: CGGC domain-containing protein [Lentisphaeria bacterium]|nr:MAG: hypothetical protein A2X47_02845 [Lentisphaerae bacterium GWF2_38_69]HBM15379.1 CGGC domain-containing protein [Lentisphaeria bacterium]